MEKGGGGGVVHSNNAEVRVMEFYKVAQNCFQDPLPVLRRLPFLSGHQGTPFTLWLPECQVVLGAWFFALQNIVR